MSGNPERTAGPKRKRLIVWGLLLAITSIFVVFACVWTLVPVGSRTITVARETTYVLGPLRHDGGVDYVAALNERFGQGVTPENNAAVLILQAMGPQVIPDVDSGYLRETVYSALGMEPLPEEDDYFVQWEDLVKAAVVERPAGQASQPVSQDEEEELRDELRRLTESPWLAEDHPAFASWVRKNEKPLELVRRASQRTRFFVPRVVWGDSDSLIGAWPEGLWQVRDVGWALACRGMLHAGRGETEAAWGDALALHRLSRLLAQDPPLISLEVAWVLDQKASRIAIQIATSGKLDPREAKAMLRQMDELPAWSGLSTKLDWWGRFCSLDMASRLAREASPHDLEDFGCDVRRIDADLMLRHINVCYDRLAAAFAPPTLATQRAAVEGFKQYASTAIYFDGEWSDHVLRRARFVLKSPRAKCEEMSIRAANWVLCTFLPAEEMLLEFRTRMTARNDLARVALGLAAFHSNRGVYPSSLAELSPEYLASVPPDPFTDAPLHYRRQEEGYILYSVGLDGEDDGGSDEQVEWHAWTVDKDIVVRVP